MSGERPLSPLWPVGLQRFLTQPTVENKRNKAPTNGVYSPVVKQPELSKPGEQPATQQDGTHPEPKVVFSGESVAQGSQSEAKPGNAAVPEDQRENKKKFDFSVHPSKSDSNWKRYSKRERQRIDDEWFHAMVLDGIQQDYEARQREFDEQGYVRYPPKK